MKAIVALFFLSSASFSQRSLALAPAVPFSKLVESLTDSLIGDPEEITLKAKDKGFEVGKKGKVFAKLEEVARGELGFARLSNRDLKGRTKGHSTEWFRLTDQAAPKLLVSVRRFAAEKIEESLEGAALCSDFGSKLLAKLGPASSEATQGTTRVWEFEARRVRASCRDGPGGAEAELGAPGKRVSAALPQGIDLLLSEAEKTTSLESAQLEEEIRAAFFNQCETNTDSAPKLLRTEGAFMWFNPAETNEDPKTWVARTCWAKSVRVIRHKFDAFPYVGVLVESIDVGHVREAYFLESSDFASKLRGLASAALEAAQRAKARASVPSGREGFSLEELKEALEKKLRAENLNFQFVEDKGKYCSDRCEMSYELKAQEGTQVAVEIKTSRESIQIEQVLVDLSNPPIAELFIEQLPKKFFLASKGEVPRDGTQNKI